MAQRGLPHAAREDITRLGRRPTRFRRGKKIEAWLVTLTGLGSAGAVLYIAIYGWLAGQWMQPYALKHPTRLLVIAPHPDDELVIAGGLMVQNQELGGQTRVVYVTDGNAYLKGKLQELYAVRRRREARSAMKYLGVPRDQLIFLGFQDEWTSFSPETTSRIAQALKKEVETFDPELVITTAYEGGHCVHDLLNALVARAVAGRLSTDFYEATAYNPYFGWENPRKVLRPFVHLVTHLLPGKPELQVDPAFVPPGASAATRDTPVYQTKLTFTQRRRKNGALKKYPSQNMARVLQKRYNRGEIFRPHPDHNYDKPPFDLSQSLNYRLCDRWVAGTKPGRWLLKQYGTPALTQLPNTVGGDGARPQSDAGHCLQYSVCRIQHSEFLDRLPPRSD